MIGVAHTPRLSALRVVLTAHAFTEDRERFLDAGIDGYVAKPVNLEELLRQIEELCRRRQS